MAQYVFERYEKKYLLNRQQYNGILERFSGRLQPDIHESYTIMNLYYDTDNFDIIQRSLEKPVYKEKLRLRSYGQPGQNDMVYLELKKKYRNTVYKRRIALPLNEIRDLMAGDIQLGNQEQICKEIRYFVQQNPVKEKVQLCYDRKAYTGIQDNTLRVTFDSGIKFRQHELGLEKGGWGEDILSPGEKLMEIKLTGAMPLWLSRTLSELSIFPVSFSKYGVCYKKILAGGNRKGAIQSA